MQILGNLFNAVLFVSVIGSIFTVISLFVNHVLRCALPLWFALCGMIFFCVPFLSPDVFFISPETQDWVHGYRIASILWASGCGVLLAHDLIRLFLARRALMNIRCSFTDRQPGACSLA